MTNLDGKRRHLLDYVRMVRANINLRRAQRGRTKFIVVIGKRQLWGNLLEKIDKSGRDEGLRGSM